MPTATRRTQTTLRTQKTTPFTRALSRSAGHVPGGAFSRERARENREAAARARAIREAVPVIRATYAEEDSRFMDLYDAQGRCVRTACVLTSAVDQAGAWEQLWVVGTWDDGLISYSVGHRGERPLRFPEAAYIQAVRENAQARRDEKARDETAQKGGAA